jgi:hypothetical protein
MMMIPGKKPFLAASRLSIRARMIVPSHLKCDHYSHHNTTKIDALVDSVLNESLPGVVLACIILISAFLALCYVEYIIQKEEYKFLRIKEDVKEVSSVDPYGHVSSIPPVNGLLHFSGNVKSSHSDEVAAPLAIKQLRDSVFTNLQVPHALYIRRVTEVFQCREIEMERASNNDKQQEGGKTYRVEMVSATVIIECLGSVTSSRNEFAYLKTRV